ncbi:uncharacterized protein LOC129581163 isoform X2 [Paramacrobiotus metropolitanus]|uniref:uncharacterized protein LOC129581163 isoform X2 n=1 Tax=Paramacrobiotus metropolitanus TaxID=2943436 RepID=UPI0024464132|nr:uncharacterized protein LOC129581163 isoform X2 [Paramacrobiotus metropolitanus]
MKTLCAGCSAVLSWTVASRITTLTSRSGRFLPHVVLPHYSTLPAAKIHRDLTAQEETHQSSSVPSVSPQQDEDIVPGWHTPESYALLREIANKTTLPSPRLFGSYGVGKPLVGELAPIRPREHRWQPQPQSEFSERFQAVIARQRPSTNYMVFKFKQRDRTMRGVMMWFQERHLAKRRRQQSYDAQRNQLLGPELAAARVFLSRGARVKFEGVDRWYGRSEGNLRAVPSRFLDTVRVEAIDATGTDVLYEALENLVGLRYLRSLTLRDCKDVDDFCIPKLYILSNTLEYLDLSGCPKISERGLACLYHLRNLKTLVIENMPKVENKELYALLLEDELPFCEMVGVEYNQVEIPKPTLLESRESKEAEWKKLNVPLYDAIARPDSVEVGNPSYSDALLADKKAQALEQERRTKELMKKYE